LALCPANQRFDKTLIALTDEYHIERGTAATGLAPHPVLFLFPERRYFESMKALAVLYGGNLSGQAFEEVFPGTSALNSALERAASFPGVARIALLLDQAAPSSVYAQNRRPG
jgi:hypothetical protein